MSIVFYREGLSGHCHRVAMLLTMLELPLESIDVDIPRGDLQRPESLPCFVPMPRTAPLHPR